MSKAYQPKTGEPCGCRRGVQRDNCPDCEGTGQRIDFAAIRARSQQATHTPGPWTWDAVWSLIKGPNGEEVAAVHSGENIGQRLRPEIAGANARLMTSAPDLLTALKEMIRLYDECQNKGDDSIISPKVIAGYEAIIARAEGR